MAELQHLIFPAYETGIGQLVAGFFAWTFIPKHCCSDADTCNYSNNKGWRYVWYTSGTLVFVLSIIRILALRLRETPKFLLGKGRDEEVIDILNAIATKYDRSCSLTLEALQACDLAGPQIIVHEQGSQVCKMNTMRRGLFFSVIFSTTPERSG